MEHKIEINSNRFIIKFNNYYIQERTMKVQKLISSLCSFAVIAAASLIFTGCGGKGKAISTVKAGVLSGESETIETVATKSMTNLEWDCFVENGKTFVSLTGKYDGTPFCEDSSMTTAIYFSVSINTGIFEVEKGSKTDSSNKITVLSAQEAGLFVTDLYNIYRGEYLLTPQILLGDLVDKFIEACDNFDEDKAESLAVQIYGALENRSNEFPQDFINAVTEKLETGLEYANGNWYYD